jgi:hypothetical protein
MTVLQAFVLAVSTIVTVALITHIRINHPDRKE